MGPGADSFRTISPIRRSRAWSFILFLLLAAQFALGLHQLEHRINPDAALGDDCALCHFTSSMAAAPEAEAFAPPVLVAIDSLTPPTQAAPVRTWSALAFSSRAPPLPVSA